MPLRWVLGGVDFFFKRQGNFVARARFRPFQGRLRSLYLRGSFLNLHNVFPMDPPGLTTSFHRRGFQVRQLNSRIVTTVLGDRRLIRLPCPYKGRSGQAGQLLPSLPTPMVTIGTQRVGVRRRGVQFVLVGFPRRVVRLFHDHDFVTVFRWI